MKSHLEAIIDILLLLLARDKKYLKPVPAYLYYLGMAC